jgi:hypothetical protein
VVTGVGFRLLQLLVQLLPALACAPIEYPVAIDQVSNLHPPVVAAPDYRCVQGTNRRSLVEAKAWK